MSWPSIGGLASTSLGVTYFGGVSADFFGRFLLPDGTGFANLSTAAPRTYAGLVTRASDQAMYAVRPASVTGDAGLVSHTVAPVSGALTFKATYANPTALLDLADAVVESASLPTLYAVSGTNTSIYKFDHLNGNSLEWLSDAPFQIESIAVTPDGSHVYYVEKAASGWRLGDYDSSTNLHTIRGALSNPALDYVISSQPQNLMYQNGRLYFIAEGTDDLVAVEFTDTGSPTIRKVVKVADVNGNVALTNIGDIAADSTGVMYISASNAFATWNFASQSGFTVRNATPADYWAGLVVKGTELYGVSHLQPGKLYHVDKTTGNGTYIADYNPAASFIDFAAPQPNIAMDAGGQTYFITTSSPNIDRLDLTNGQQYDVTSQVPLLPTGIALDHAGGVVYTVGSPVSGTGILLAKYDLSTGLNTTLGSLTAAGLSYVPAETPHNLAFFNGNLYYLAAHTDDLVKIVLSGNTVAAQTKVWDVGVPNYLWETLAIGPDSSAYLSTSEAHYLARINIAQQAGPVVIKNSKGADEGADYVALTFDAAGQMHGTVSHQNVKGYQVNPVTGATAYHWDGVRYGGSGVPILDTTSPYSNAPISVGDQFATDGTTSIFRVNPVNGTVTLLTNEGLFPMQALAYDASTRVLYYTENTSPNWRLAKYDLASNTHTLLGNLDEPTVANAWNFNPTARPTSLSYFSGNLYYIHNNSDDLIRIDLSNGGIANQTLVADITNGVKNFGVVGDLTTTSDGRLWIAAENELATFQLTTLSNYTLLRTTTSAQPGAEAYYPGLQSDIWNGIYADRQGVDTGIYKLNATGAETSMVATTPSTSLIDYAGAESSPPLPQVTNNLFAVNGTKSIFRVNPANAQNVVIDRTAPYNLQALAYDAVTNSLFYLEESTSATWRIGCYHLTSGLHSSVLGDLKLIGTNKPTISPSSLVFYNQALYYLHPNSANLVKVSLNLAMDTILDQTNIPLGTSFQTIGDLALDDTGLLYWVNTNGASHTLYRYDLRNNTGLVSMGAASAAYPALAFFGGTLYGTGGNGFALDSLNTGSGVGTLVAQTQPNQTFQDFAAASTAPAPVSADFYAIGAGAKTIYRLDPATGANVPINNTAPYNLGALALDGTHRALLYLEETTAAAATWSLGRYDLTTKTHTALGDIKAAVNAFSPTAVPHNLTYYNGALYLIVPGHDDLIKIQLNAAGTAVTSISRAAILTGGALVFDAPGDLACNNAGLLYFTNAPSSGSPMLYRYDLIGAGGFGIVGNTAQVDLALGFSGDQLYAAAPAAGTFVDRLSTLTASITGTTATSPPLAFTDFAGPSTDTPPSGSDAMWAVVPYVSGFSGSTDPHLVKFTNYQNSGGNVDRIDYGILAYQNGGTVTSFAGNPSSIEAMTVDAGQQLYFVRSAATVVAGITYERPLFVLNLNNLSGSSVANFVGDLGPSLRTESGISPLTSNEVVSGLAVGADGKLRLVLRKDTGAVTDVLMRVESLTPNASGALSVTLLGPLQNGATSAGNAKGLAIDSTGQAYVTDADDLGVYKVNATTGVLTLPMYSTEGSGGPVAVHLSDADVVTALPNRTISKVVAGNANDPAYFHTLNLWGLDAPTAIAFPGLAITPPAAVNGYFAASGTASIYRLDPLSGANIVATTAPFAVQSVAFDQAANRLYYVEAATSNWRLGRYDVASNTHSLYNFTLQTPGGVNQTPLTNQPENLFIANGGLYTIPPNTDDVVKIDLTPTGIDSIHKITDLNNEVSQGNVTAASIDNVGNLYLASTAVLAKFNLPVMGGYTTVASNPNIPWSGLVMNGANNLYGIRSDDPYKTFSINPTSGATTYAAPILPRVAFTDITFASGPYLPSSGYAFASTTSSPSIHRVDLATAKDYVMTWQAKANVEAVAYDQVNGLVYYLDTGDSPIRIHAYNLLTDAHTTLRDASFQTDLKQIGTNRPTGAHPHHLVHFNGALYYIATGTDDLFRITFTSPLVIADQVKVADIAGNAAVGNVVGAFTVDDNGIAYLSYEDADVLARFDMRTLGGFTVISNTALTARYHAMTYDSSTLFGVPYSAPDNLKLFQLAVANGNRTLVGSVNPSLQLLDLSTSTPAQPALPAPTSNFFAITGGNKNLYRLDPTTGQNVLLNNTAAYNLGAIAYDLVSGNIYYLEDGADATWNMGKYNVSTSTHAASLGNIKTISGVATAYPGNLVFYNNALYYIQPGSSKLTKAQLDGAASAILSQTTLDLGTVFNSVGDLALDDAGVLYWVSTNGSTNTLYKYDLRNQTGFAAVATTTRAYPALGFLSNTCYGSGANAYVIDSINPTTATTSIASTAQPNLVFADFAAPSSAAIPAPPVWAIGENGNAQLLRINGYDGAPTLENFGDIRYPGPSAILTAFPADSDIESFAVTADGFAYFVRNKDTTVNGATYGRPLFRMDLNGVSVGNVQATFLGDLDQALSVMNGAAINTTSNLEGVSALAVGSDGALYGVYQRGTDSVVDKLFKLTSLSVDGAGNLAGVAAVGNITNGTSLGTQVDALEFHSNGTLYAFDTKDGEMLVLNPATAAVTGVHSVEAGTTIKEITISPLTNDFIAANVTDKSIKRVNASGPDTALFSYQASPPWGTPSFSDMVGLKFPARNFNPANVPPPNVVYACTGGNKDIYSLDLTTGATAKVVDNAAAFNLNALAYDPVQNTVFYLQDTPSGYALGSWQLATNTHSIIYDLTVNNDYNSVQPPSNLTWWGGYLWFIEPGTDDLVRITTSPTAATQQIKMRDITANTVIFSTIGDLAVDDSGVMYFTSIVAGNSRLARMNMLTLSSYTNINTQTGSADYCPTLVFGPDAGSGRPLYGTRDTARSILRTINTVNGVISTTSTATTPSVAMIDTSDRHLFALPPLGTYYAVAGGTDRSIYAVNPETGTSTLLTTAPASFAGVSAIAWDQTGGYLYYLEEASSNFKLGRYSLDTGIHVSLGSLQGSFFYNPTSKPGNLGFLRGSVYYIASGTDDLVRIDVSDTAVLNEVKISDLNSNVSLGNVGDLVASNYYTAYFTANNQLWSFSTGSMSSASPVATFTQGTPDALAVRTDGTGFYGTFNPAIAPAASTEIYKISTAGAVSTNVSTGLTTFRDFASPDISRPDDYSGYFFIGGSFGLTNTSYRGIARLNRNTGALDYSFNAADGPNAGGTVTNILPVENGTVLGSGSFSSFEGQPATGIIKLRPDGSVDQTFRPIFR